MDDDVREDDLPGIGRRFELACEDGGAITVVVHNSGRRDLYAFSPETAEPTVVTMRDEQADTLAAILEGTWSNAPEARGVRQAMGDVVIDWVTLQPGSPATGRTIGDLEIRSGTGATVMSIVRQGGVVEHPDAGEELRAGDRLVVAARRGRLAEFRRLVVGPER